MSLFSPLEGFKSFAYDYTFTNINSSGENFNLGGGFFNNLNNNDFFLIKKGVSFWWGKIKVKLSQEIDSRLH